MFQVYLLLGANLGDRFNQMQLAFQEVEVRIGQVIQHSSLYETAAWGIEDGPDYLNQVLRVETPLAPFEVLKQIAEIETHLGRTRKLKWESRVIDIDILYYEDVVLDTPELSIPHPYLHFRKFTLVPLAEIAPDFVHPVFKKNNEKLLEELNDALEVKKVEFPEKTLKKG